MFIDYLVFTSIRVVLGMSADKDISEVLSEVLKEVPSDRIHCTEVCLLIFMCNLYDITLLID